MVILYTMLFQFIDVYLNQHPFCTVSGKVKADSKEREVEVDEAASMCVVI